MSKTITVHADVKIPTVPNYLLLEDGAAAYDAKLDVADVSDESLRELGAAWTEALIENAQKRRTG